MEFQLNEIQNNEMLRRLRKEDRLGQYALAMFGCMCALLGPLGNSMSIHSDAMSSTTKVFFF